MTAVLVALYLCVPLVLSVLPFTEPLAGPLFGYFLSPLQAIWAAFVGYLPSAILVVIADRHGRPQVDWLKAVRSVN